MPPARPATIISICPDGPLLVRGDFELRDIAGDNPVDARRRVIALCRCGRSLIKPFCDGSHAMQPRPGGGEAPEAGLRRSRRSGPARRAGPDHRTATGTPA